MAMQARRSGSRAADISRAANDSFESDPPAQSRSRERPVSARLARCRVSPRRSLDRTDSSHSTVTAATALYAPQLTFARMALGRLGWWKADSCFAGVSLHFGDVRQLPRLVEVGLGRAVEPEVGEPAPVRDRLDPVAFGFAGRRRRAEIEVGRAVGIDDDVIARRPVGVATGVNKTARLVVVDRERPELRDRRVLRHMQRVALVPLQPLPDCVLRGFEIDLTGADGAPHHTD